MSAGEPSRCTYTHPPRSNRYAGLSRAAPGPPASCLTAAKSAEVIERTARANKPIARTARMGTSGRDREWEQLIHLRREWQICVSLHISLKLLIAAPVGYHHALGEPMLKNQAAGTTLHRTLVPMFLALALVSNLAAQSHRSSGQGWKFAISGDSRNCGDIVMPAIAAQVRADGAEFYWHLGDYRALSNFDEDYRRTHPDASI